jgi:hypothetical protein
MKTINSILATAIMLVVCTANTYAYTYQSPTDPITPWRNDPANQTWNTQRPNPYQQYQDYRQDQLNQDLRQQLDRQQMNQFMSPPVNIWR